MRTITDHLHGRQVLNGDVTFNGLLEGDLIVPAGMTLEMNGTVNGIVEVQTGGVARINGMVNGTVINNGGDVSIYGVVDMVGGTHPSKVDPKAVINKS